MVLGVARAPVPRLRVDLGALAEAAAPPARRAPARGDRRGVLIVHVGVARMVVRDRRPRHRLVDAREPGSRTVELDRIDRAPSAADHALVAPYPGTGAPRAA